MTGELVYLAAPYSHPDPAVREERFKQANRAAGRLMQEGRHVFSPISHTHPIALCCELPGDFAYWKEYNRAMLSRCTSLAVLMLDGWRGSVGVTAELRLAEELGLPVEYLEP